MAWARGMKAVCVRKPFPGWMDFVGVPVAGPAPKEVVTVSGVREGAGFVGLFLSEYPDPNGFMAHWFRPLTKVTRTEEQDVSMFKRIADSAPSEIIPQVDA